MINVSAEFLREMNRRTDFKERATVTLQDGTVFNWDENHFTIENNSLSDAGGNDFPLGVAVEKFVQLEVDNHDDRYSKYDFLGAVVELKLAFELSETTEVIDYGTYTVINPETYGSTIIMVAVDDMYKADKPFTTNLTLPCTIGALYRDICDTIGVVFDGTPFYNEDYLVSKLPEDDITYRQVLGYIAMLACGNARFDYNGTLRIHTYGRMTPSYSGGTFDYTTADDLDGGDYSFTEATDYDGGDFRSLRNNHVLNAWQDLKVATDDVIITGIKADAEVEQDDETVEVTYIEGVEGYVIDITSNELIKGDEQNAVKRLATLIGVSFRTFEGTYIGYPIAEFMDTAYVVDRKGNVYSTYITDIQFTFFGYTTLACKAEEPLRHSSNYNGSVAQAYQKARELVTKEKTAREKAIDDLNKKIVGGAGTFLTEKILDDGSRIYYLHNKDDEPNASGVFPQSNLVWKMTANGFGISNDYGSTYTFGLDSWGNAIMNIVSANGINANWINAGALTIKMLIIKLFLVLTQRLKQLV